jgi:hypothetical protein
MFDWLDRYFAPVSPDGTRLLPSGKPSDHPTIEEYRRGAKRQQLRQMTPEQLDYPPEEEVAPQQGPTFDDYKRLKHVQMRDDNRSQSLIQHMEDIRRANAQQQMRIDQTAETTKAVDGAIGQGWDLLKKGVGYGVEHLPGAGMLIPQAKSLYDTVLGPRQPGPANVTEDRADRAPNPSGAVATPHPVARPPAAAAPAQEAPVDPVAEIAKKRAMIDQMYPQLPPQADGSALDAETEKEKQRANYLAQLAFFSGVTQGAGGSWEGVGKGLAGAGAAYSEGFSRYQKALSNKMERANERAKEVYANDVGRTDAALKLYQNDSDREIDRLKLQRQEEKDRTDSILKQLGLIKPEAGDMGVDPTQWDDYTKTVGDSLNYKRLVLHKDVSDK